MRSPHPRSPGAGLMRALRKLLRDDRGVSAVFFALSISSTVGVVGLGVETGLWFSERRQYQTAADAGAIAGAMQMATQMTANQTAALDTTSTGSAWKETVRNGATDNTANILVSQLSSPTRARVDVTQPKASILAGLALPDGVTITTAAEATVVSLGSPCITALSTADVTAISVQGGATLNAPNCIITSNSPANGTTTGGNDPASVIVAGNATLNAAQIRTAGSVAQNGTSSVEAPLTGMGDSTNPFADLPDPSTTLPPATPCVTVAAGTLTGGSGTQFCSSGNGNVTLANGTFTLDGVFYVNNGNFTIGPNATVTSGADGATIIMTGTNKIGSITVSASATNPVTLTAPSTGTYKGLVFYQDPDAPAPANNNTSGNGVNSFNGGSGLSMSITGGIYTPSQTVVFQGNASTECLTVVAKFVNFSGTSNLNTAGCSNVGLILPEFYTVSLTL
jgi:hypothetical protein